jgi:hypothetical protein
LIATLRIIIDLPTYKTGRSNEQMSPAVIFLSYIVSIYRWLMKTIFNSDYCYCMPQRNIIDLNRGINEFRGVTNIEVTYSRMRIVIHLQILTKF